MLKPVIYTFLNFFYIDSFVLNVAYQAAAVLWDYFYTKDDFLHHTVPTLLSHAIQFAIGFLVAQLFRIIQHRFGWRHWHFFNVDLDHMRPLIVAIVAFLSLTFYQHSIHDSFFHFADPYPIGATRALLLYIGVLGLIEMYEHAMRVSHRVFNNTSDNILAMIVGIVVIAVDTLAFERGGRTVAPLALAYFVCVGVASWFFKLAMQQK